MPSGHLPTPPRRRRLQFDLWFVLELTAGVALLFALLLELGSAGTLVAMAALVALGYAVWVPAADTPQRRRRRLVTMTFATLLAWFASCPCWFPFVSIPREYARRSVCRNNLQQLAIALSIYYDEYGSFPPATLPGPDGQPAHSWRVLVLPYADHSDVYDRYRFDEPWDGPNNALLGPIDFMECPSIAAAGGNTGYFFVVGSGRLPRGQDVLRLEDIKDGPENTILVIETDAVSVPWAAARDLTVDELLGPPAPGQPAVFSGPHYVRRHDLAPRQHGVHALMADGSVRLLRGDLDAATLRALLTIDGGEPIDWDAIELRGGEDLPLLRMIALAAGYVAAVALRRHVARRRRRTEPHAEAQ